MNFVIKVFPDLKVKKIIKYLNFLMQKLSIFISRVQATQIFIVIRKLILTKILNIWHLYEI